MSTLCPKGHAMRLHNAGQRTFQHSERFEDYCVVGWCDVCLSKCDETEHFTCPDCLFDICFKCCEGGREAYLMTIQLTSGHLHTVSNFIHGTVEIDARSGGALTSLDFDLDLLTFGDAPNEQLAITAGKVELDNTEPIHKLRSITLSYQNKQTKKDLILFDQTIAKLEFANGHFTCTVKSLPKQAGKSLLKSRPEQELKSTGKVTFTRFFILDFPYFLRDLGSANSALPRTRGELPFSFFLLQKFARERRNVFSVMSPNREEDYRRRSSVQNSSKNAPLTKRKLKQKLDEQLRTGQQIKTGLQVARKTSALEEELGLAELQQVLENPDISPKDLMYACSLCVLTYLTKPKHFQTYYSREREERSLDPFWLNFLKRIRKNEGKELLRQWLSCRDEDGLRARKVVDLSYQMFLPSFLVTNFETDELSPKFGLPKNLNEGALHNMGLEFYPVNQPGQAPGREGVYTFRNSEMFVACSKNIETLGGDLIFAFQGGNDAGDVLMCLNCLSTPFEPIVEVNAGSCACMQGSRLRADDDAFYEVNDKRVHIGWYNAFLGFKEMMECCLRDVLTRVPKDKPVRLVVVGHSAGAALATNTMGWLLQLFDGESKYSSELLIKGELTGEPSDRLRILCVTFGSPKIGNRAFSEWFDSHRFVTGGDKGRIATRARYYRGLQLNDPFTTLPPTQGAGFDYRHMTSSAFYVDDFGKLVKVSPTGIDKLEHTTRGLAIFAQDGIDKILLSHDMFSYTQRLLNYFWRERREMHHSDASKLITDPFMDAFGDGKYQYHDFTRSPDFLVDF